MQRTMRLPRFRTWVLCTLLVGASTARAEGPGIALGDRLLLHLGLGVEFRFNDNIFFQSDNAKDTTGATIPKTSAFELRLLPTIDLTTRTARGSQSPNVDFRLHAGMTYTEFLTADQSISQHRNFGVDFGALLTLFPMGRYSLSLFDNYARTTQLPYGGATVPYNYNRDTNELGTRLKLAPGGGRLQIDFTYAFGLDFFEPQALNPSLKDENNFYHKLALRAGWKFFPKTALYLQADETIYQFQVPKSSDLLTHPDSYQLRVELGLQGFITAKLSVNGYVGYGNGFYVNSKTNPNTPIGGLALTWKPTLLSVGALGYKHDFANSLLGESYDGDSVFLSWTQLIWRFTAYGRLQYSNLRYQGIPPSLLENDASTRTDNVVQLDLRVDYSFKTWLTLSLGYDLSYDNPDKQLKVTNTLLAPADYLVNEVWLRLAVLY
jgi:hypothetical protein